MHRGEKRIATGDGEDIIFKLDAKLVLLYDHAEYPVCAAEFAPYAGLKRIKTDRSKLLVEAKVICDKIMNLELSEEQAALLSVVNVQVVGLETSTVSVKLVDNHLYAANTISSYTLPSTVSQLKQHCKDVIGQIFDLKYYTLNTADIIKQTLNDKKSKKSMKRKLQEDQDESLPPLTAKPAPTWRHKARKQN